MSRNLFRSTTSTFRHSKLNFSSSVNVKSSLLPRIFGIRDRLLQSENEHSVRSNTLLQKIQNNQEVKITVTGPAGAIGYGLLFRLCNGELLGNTPISLRCLELPHAMNALKGVAMELEDCAFPNLTELIITDDPHQAFDGTEIALMIGSKPRGPGMERADLIRDNGQIFEKLGKVMNEKAARYCRTTVVGNPCNTNCLILASNCPDIDRNNFTAMTRLDHDRGLSLISSKVCLPVNEINYFGIWGNHSSSLFPDLTNTLVHGVDWDELIGKYKSDRFFRNEFIPRIQQRGATIINVRGSSSAASAGSACLAHTRDWIFGTPQPDWTSMAIFSNGEYNVPNNLVFSFPVWCKNGYYQVASTTNQINAYQQYWIEKNIQELKQERDVVANFIR